jgi:hypothetical protein
VKDSSSMLFMHNGSFLSVEAKNPKLNIDLKIFFPGIKCLVQYGVKLITKKWLIFLKYERSSTCYLATYATESSINITLKNLRVRILAQNSTTPQKIISTFPQPLRLTAFMSENVKTLNTTYFQIRSQVLITSVIKIIYITLNMNFDKAAPICATTYPPPPHAAH